MNQTHQDGRVAFSAPSAGSTIRRMSSELEAMDHEAQSYLEHEREQFKKVIKGWLMGFQLQSDGRACDLCELDERTDQSQ